MDFEPIWLLDIDFFLNDDIDEGDLHIHLVDVPPCLKSYWKKFINKSSFPFILGVNVLVHLWHIWLLYTHYFYCLYASYEYVLWQRQCMVVITFWFVNEWLMNILTNRYVIKHQCFQILNYYIYIIIVILSLLVSRPFYCNSTHCHLYIPWIPRFRGHINLYMVYISKWGFPFKQGSKSLFSFILNSSSYLFFSFFATRVFRWITLIHQTCKYFYTNGHPKRYHHKFIVVNQALNVSFAISSSLFFNLDIKDHYISILENTMTYFIQSKYHEFNVRLIYFQLCLYLPTCGKCNASKTHISLIKNHQFSPSLYTRLSQPFNIFWICMCKSCNSIIIIQYRGLEIGYIHALSSTVNYISHFNGSLGNSSRNASRNSNNIWWRYISFEYFSSS